MRNYRLKVMVWGMMMLLGGWCVMAARGEDHGDEVTIVEVGHSATLSQAIPNSMWTSGAMEPYEFTIDEMVVIRYVTVEVTIEHEDVSDLIITLTTPWGDEVRLKELWEPLWQEPRVDMVKTVFDDRAYLTIVQGEAPYTGDFRPEGEDGFVDFRGRWGNGTWRLDIMDGWYQHRGELTEVRFKINGYMDLP